MKHLRYLIFLLLTALAIECALVGVAYKKSNAHLASTNRLPNPMFYPDNARLGIIEHFVRTRMQGSPKNVVVLGDSQPYGFQMSADKIVSAFLPTEQPVWNLAFEDARPDDTRRTIEQLEASGIALDTLIVNVNPGHAKRPDFSRLPASGQSFRTGLWLSPLACMKAVDRIEAFPNPTNFSLRKDPAYFDDLENRAYFEVLGALFEKLQSTGCRVLVYVSPHADRAIDANEYDRAAIERFTKRVEVLARQHELEAVSLSGVFTDDDFFDLVHLNERGHRKLAEALLGR